MSFRLLDFAGALRCGCWIGLCLALPPAARAQITLDVPSGQQLHYEDPITGDESVLKVGAGEAILSGQNDYSGSTTIQEGILQGYEWGLSANSAYGLGAEGTLKAVGDEQTIGSLWGSGFLVLDGALAVGALNENTTYSGTITGSQYLKKIGSGTLTLETDSQHTGGTILEGGILQLGSATALGSTGIILFTGGTLQYTEHNQTDYSSRFTVPAAGTARIDTGGQNIAFGTGLAQGVTLEKLGDGTLTLNAVNYSSHHIDRGILNLGVAGAISAAAQTPAITMQGGTLQYSAHNNEDVSAWLSTAGGQQFRFDTNGRDVTFLNGIFGAGTTVTKMGAGTLTFAVGSGYDGGTILEGGTLGINHDQALGTSRITVRDGEIRATNFERTLANALTIEGPLKVGRLTNFTGDVTLAAETSILMNNPDGDANRDSTFSGTISGDHGLTVGVTSGPGLGGIGSGAIVFSGVNSYTGPTTISSGRLKISQDRNLGAAGTKVTLDGSGILSVTADLVSGRTLEVLSGGGILETLNPFNLTFHDLSGSGDLTFAGFGKLKFSADSLYTGVLQGGSGTSLEIGSGQTFRSGNGGAKAGLELAIKNDGGLIFNLTGSGKAGAISGSGTVEKLGSGTIEVLGASTYTGDTTIRAGKLIASAPNGKIILDGGAFAMTSNTIFSNGQLEVTANGGTLDTNGHGATLHAATLNGDLTKAGDGELTLGTDSHFTLRHTLNVTGGNFFVDTFDTLKVAEGGSISGSFRVNGELDIDRSGVMNYVGGLAGAGVINLNGPGEVRFNGASTFAGLLNMNAGTLGIGHNDALGSARVDMHAGALRALGGSWTVSNDITAYDSFTIGRDLTLSGAMALQRDLTLGFSDTESSANPSSSTLSGNISGPHRLTLQGGLIRPDTVVLSGDNSFHGATIIDLTVELGSANALGASGPISIYRGTLRHTSANTVDYSGRISSDPDQDIRIDTNGQEITWGHSFGGSGSRLTLLGPGILNLNAAGFSYSGDTVISDSVLVVNVAQALSSASTVVLANKGGVMLTLRADQTIGALKGAGGDGGAVNLDGHTLTLGANDASETFSGIIDGNGGAGGIIKVGSGTQTLDGFSLYTGPTILRGGALVYGSAQALSQGGRILFEGGALRYAASGPGDLSDRFSQAGNQQYRLDTNGRDITLTTSLASQGGSLTKIGEGKLTLADVNTYTAGTTVLGGTLAIADDASLGAVSGSLTLSGSTLSNSRAATLARTVTIGSGGATFDTSLADLSISQALTGDGSLTKNGAHALNLSGAQVYNGSTTILGGVVKIADGSLASNSIAISEGAQLRFSTNGSLNATTTGGGSLRRDGSGTTVFTGSGTHTGGTFIDSGALQIGNGDNGDSTHIGGDITNNGILIFNTRVDAVNDGRITGSGGLIKRNDNNLVFTAANTYAGDTVLEGGSFELGTTVALGPDTRIVFAGGALRFSENNQLDYSAQFKAGADQQYRIDTNGQDVTFAASFSSIGGSFTKLGEGTLALTTANAYSGDTTVLGGRLTASRADSLGSGQLVLDGGEFANSAAFTFSREVVLGENGGSLASDSGSYTISGEISGEGALTKNGGGTVILSGVKSYTGSTTVTDGILRISGSSMATSSVEITGGTLALDAATYAGDVSGSGEIAAVGPGTSILTGHLQDVSVRVDAGSTLQFSGFRQDVDADSISNAGTLVFNPGESGGYRGDLSGAGTFVKEGNSDLHLSLRNTFGLTGNFVIRDGNVDVAGPGALGGAAVFLEGGALYMETDRTPLSVTISGGTYHQALSSGPGGMTATSALGATDTVASLGGIVITSTGFASMAFASSADATNDHLRRSDVLKFDQPFESYYVLTLGIDGELLNTQLGRLDNEGEWHYAIDSNFQNTATSEMLDYHGTYEDFLQQFGFDLQAQTGAWGWTVADGRTTAWAILDGGPDFTDYTNQYALLNPVPEPSTITLLALGAAAFLAAASRRGKSR